jgi:succinate dehydrogenase/fumarate reductase-like Fe-S protein
MAFNRTFAWLNLAWSFGRHVVVQMPARVFDRGAGAQRFRAAVLPEGYVPLEQSERDAIPSFMQCIHCGLCSLACPDIRDAPANAWDEAWSFVAGPSRSIDRAPAVVADISPCARCDACADVCPTGVPIPLMAATLQRLATSVPARIQDTPAVIKG